jgi:3',5'-nucleoside bisphosphate phosphatase
VSLVRNRPHRRRVSVPRGSPFTALCQQTAALTKPRATADLHTHTLASDGDYTHSQLVAFATHANLTTLAITDHDTITTFDEPAPLHLVLGVEITTQWHGRETHVLAYHVSQELDSFLAPIRAVRRRRFERLVEQLRSRGIEVDVSRLSPLLRTVGRRHLATLLWDQGIVHNRFTAFREYLSTPNEFLHELPTLAETLAVVRTLGGVTSLAHPRDDLTSDQIAELAACGLDALEVSHPTIRFGRSLELRRWAGEFGMLVTGGSDCHGADRAVGSEGITCAEIARLRQLAESRQCA